MTGTVINTLAIALGATAGIILKHGIPEKIRQTITQAVSLAVVLIGLQLALETNNPILITISLVAGGLIGQIIDVEARLRAIGEFLQRKLSSGDSRVADGFVAASLLYCVGPMAIVGALQDGLSGDSSILLAKSVLDGTMSIIFAAAMGIGVLFSGLSVLLYQGAISLLANSLSAVLVQPVVDEMSAVGGLLVFAIGLNTLEISKVKVGNLLPALFLVPFFIRIF